MSPPSPLQRYRGALLGLAAGDAAGAAVEFLPPGSFPAVTDLRGGGPFGLAPGQWTDDTSLALCLAESLTERKAFDPRDQLRRYLRWYREGHLSSTGRCFDIGGATRRALERFERTGEAFPGDADPDSAGNGSLMRLAPVPLFYAADAVEAAERSGESSRTTHGAKAAADACRYFGALLAAAVRGAEKEALLSEPWEPRPGYWQARPLHPEVEEVARGSYKRRDPPAIQGRGYVVRTLEAALWAFHRSGSFREGCLLAVNLGHDADTTAAVYGQLAGVHYGDEGIPAPWRERLSLRDTIEGLAEALLRQASPAEAGGRPSPPPPSGRAPP